MYHEEIATISSAAVKKNTFLQTSKVKYLISSALAGMYVGFGVLLAFTIGGLLSQVDSPAAKIAMGMAFGIALSLVIVAGSELFTGNNLVMAVGLLEKRVTIKGLSAVNISSFIGNLIGSLFLAVLFSYSGLLNGSTAAFILKSAQVKMSLPWEQLVLRGVLCNVLVCLAVWCSFRLKEESSKLVMVFWCLFAFVTAGFEHSIANMTLLSAALLIPASTGVSIGGFLHNICWVTLGNFIGGAFVVGYAYWYIAKKD